jgi:hydrogenase maturation protease
MQAVESALVIGYGNSLRRDDGAGLCAAQAVRAWHRPDIRVLAVQQLTPEMAEDLAASRLAVFIDAAAAPPDGSVGVLRVEPAEARATLGHTSDPQGLLALAQAVYGRHPPAWLVMIPAANCGFGQGLSRTAQRGVNLALEAVTRLLGAGNVSSACREP